MEKIAETIFPSDGTGMPSIEEAQVVEYMDDLLEHLPLKEKFLIRSLIALLELQSLVFNGARPKLFSHATLDERAKNLAGWEKSRFFQRRMVFLAIRTLLLWAYADSHEAERDMGFVPGTLRTKQRQEEKLAAARRAIAQAQGEEPIDEDDGLGQVPTRPSEPPDAGSFDASTAGS